MKPLGAAPLLPKRAEFAFGKSPFRVKGVLYLGTQSFFAEHKITGGGDGMSALLEEMHEPELRAFITQKFLAASLYDVTPVPALIVHEARVLRMSVDSYLLHRTRYQAKKDLAGVNAWLLRLASPRLVARHLPRIMLQMFDFASVEIARDEPNDVIAKMLGVPAILAPWLGVCINVYAETALNLAGVKASTNTPEIRVTGARAGLELVELTVPLRWK